MGFITTNIELGCEPREPDFRIMSLLDQMAGHARGFANPLFSARPLTFYDAFSLKSAVMHRV